MIRDKNILVGKIFLELVVAPPPSPDTIFMIWGIFFLIVKIPDD